MNADDIRARYVDGLDILPRHMHGGISRYMERGIRPGDFMLSMLMGRIEDAMTRADFENGVYREEWEAFLSAYLPSDCHGSPLKVSAWMTMGGLSGYPDAK